MIYDLTPMLTTIASCSATIVAILGGFISSKLISINTEKSEVNCRIDEIKEELEYLNKIYTEDLYNSNKEYALSFIRDNVDELLEKTPLKVMGSIRKEERPILSYDDMLPFWDRALNLLSNLANEYEYNSEGVPISYAKKEDDFDYEIYLIIRKRVEKLQKKKKCSEDSFGMLSSLNIDIDDLITSDAVVGNSILEEQNLAHTKNKIDYLELELRQKQNRIKFLQYPKGMSLGVIIFTLFSIFGIIVPLLYVPFSTYEHTVYVKYAIFFIGAFSSCIIATIAYFIWLLKQN